MPAHCHNRTYTVAIPDIPVNNIPYLLSRMQYLLCIDRHQYPLMFPHIFQKVGFRGEGVDFYSVYQPPRPQS